MKFHLIIITAIALIACKDRKSEMIELTSKKVVMTNQVNEVLLNFRNNKCNNGVPSVRMLTFCDGQIAEIWCTEGWAALMEENPKFYSEVNGFHCFVYDSLFYSFKDELSDLEITQLVGDRLKIDIGLPPRSGFTDRWLYRLDYPPNLIYSIADSLFKYENNRNMSINLKAYTGEAICF